jgi:hypothetical protein
LLMPREQSHSLGCFKMVQCTFSIRLDQSMGIFARVSSEILMIFCEYVDFSSEFMCCKWAPLFLRFKASAVTLSGSQVGNVLPLPHSKGGVFPFLLTSMGAPLLSANLRSEITGPTPYSGNFANICYISMNHFETATATKQEKGISKKRNPPVQ